MKTKKHDNLEYTQKLADALDDSFIEKFREIIPDDMCLEDIVEVVFLSLYSVLIKTCFNVGDQIKAAYEGEEKDRKMLEIRSLIRSYHSRILVDIREALPRENDCKDKTRSEIPRFTSKGRLGKSKMDELTKDYIIEFLDILEEVSINQEELIHMNIEKAHRKHKKKTNTPLEDAKKESIKTAITNNVIMSSLISSLVDNFLKTRGHYHSLLGEELKKGDSEREAQINKEFNDFYSSVLGGVEDTFKFITSRNSI